MEVFSASSERVLGTTEVGWGGHVATFIKGNLPGRNGPDSGQAEDSAHRKTCQSIQLPNSMVTPLLGYRMELLKIRP